MDAGYLHLVIVVTFSRTHQVAYCSVYLTQGFFKKAPCVSISDWPKCAKILKNNLFFLLRNPESKETWLYKPCTQTANTSNPKKLQIKIQMSGFSAKYEISNVLKKKYIHKQHRLLKKNLFWSFTGNAHSGGPGLKKQSQSSTDTTSSLQRQ
ncbi:hypothetical protein ILYODFUR_026943 [Ilyodon furcidens]|uniref:Uncharacterized protein n=1 Tax=Ilyodon furcidens TaxID=33524 RepID=A0ABV0TY04_9TELE